MTVVISSFVNIFLALLLDDDVDDILPLLRPPAEADVDGDENDVALLFGSSSSFEDNVGLPKARIISMVRSLIRCNTISLFVLFILVMLLLMLLFSSLLTVVVVVVTAAAVAAADDDGGVVVVVVPLPCCCCKHCIPETIISYA
jgi:hypothetical protein